MPGLFMAQKVPRDELGGAVTRLVRARVDEVDSREPEFYAVLRRVARVRRASRVCVRGGVAPPPAAPVGARSAGLSAH